MGESFVEMIRTAFRFLETEFDFAEVLFQEDLGKPYSGGWVEYGSPSTIVSIVVDKMEAVGPTYVGRVKDRPGFGRMSRITLDTICEFALTTPQERLRLASRDSEELKRDWSDIAKRVLVGMSSLRQASSKVAPSSTEALLVSDAQLLREFGEPYLRGDFSKWLELCEFQWNWLVGSELSNWSWAEEPTVEKAEAMFHRTRAYLQALRHEHSRE
jgi:hypothetical protein